MDQTEISDAGVKRELPRGRQIVYLLLGIALFVATVLFLKPEPQQIGDQTIVLSAAGRMCIGLLVVAIFYWITEALPFHITALIVMLVMPLLGITDGMEILKDGQIVQIHGISAGYKEIVRLSFGNDLILFFLGVFLISGAFSQTSLGQRMTLKMLQLMGTSTRGVILGFLVMGSLLSMWVSDVGVAAIMLPIGVGILKQAGRKPLQSNFGRGLMIASCWGAIFGGIATPAGCGPNPIAISFMSDLGGMQITFLDWMKIGVPASLMLIPFGWIVLLLIFPPEIKRLPMTREDIRAQLRQLGPLGREEIGTMVVFVIVIFLWVFNPLISKLTSGLINLPISYVSILGGMLLFVPPFRVLDWERANRAISWESIVLIMASLGLGMMTYHTGAAKWLAVTLLGGVQGMSTLLLIFVVVLVVILMKLFLASNTVTGIIIIPILISLAQAFGIDPWMLVGPAAFTSSLGIILVTQTPTNIIPYTAGYFTIGDFAKAGVVMSIVMTIVITLAIAVIGPLSGMYNF
ncbi:MAG: DASS family sodium-coupled anion symporter [Candidatus Alcyoniella australis]|nr:DASS family sodium-coupled anion symporter [Candidatus Alcyoniella australis]